jgi:signal transduction histidine kinase
MTLGRVAVRRPAWLRYSAAVIATCLVIAGRVALNPWWGRQHNRHLVFLPTAMVVAWFGGRGPGLLSTALSTLALATFWVDPGHEPVTQAVVELGLFFVIAGAISFLIDSLHRARARAEAASRSRERVLEIVAHDLGNPLSAIRLTAETSRGSVLREEQRRDLDRISRAAWRMENLLRDLVDVTRAEHDALVVTLKPEPVQPILVETADAFLPEAERRHITLEIDTPKGDVAIAVDRARILQLLGNLVGNALKFTPEGGRVTVRALARERELCFEVADTGPGIPPDDISHIFEQYWRGSGPGTGLGLFIARQIALAHRGELTVKSAPGAGTIFSFRLPVSRAEEHGA